MPKKLLFIAYYFPPLAASGSLRAAALARHLPHHGYDPYVVASAPESVYPPIASDSSLNALVSTGIIVERLTYTTPLQKILSLRAKLRLSLGRHHSQAPHSGAISESVKSRVPQPSSLKRRIADRLFLFPDQQYPWVKRILNHVGQMPKNELPDIVLATGDPWSSLVAAVQVSKRLQIPAVLDFRDPWIGNPKPIQTHGVFRTAPALERKVLEDANLVVANTSELCKDFKCRYPDLSEKFSTITNGFDSSFPIPNPSDGIRSKPRGPVEIIHFGSVYDLRSPFKLLRAALDAVEDNNLHPDDLRIRFIGHWGVRDPICETLFQKLATLGLVRRQPPLPHDECLRLMKRADFLLVLQQDFPLQIPAKLYEYVSTGRPIVLIGGRGATENLIERHNLGVTVENDLHALKTFLTDLVDSRKTVSAPDLDTLKKFHYSTIAHQMAQTLDRALQAN